MIYRPATIEDAPALGKLGAETFIASFGHLYTPENLAAFLTEVYSAEAVAQEIAAEDCIHRLAEEDGTLIAFCKLRYPTKFGSYSEATNPIELGQLYALPGYTGHGIGAKLMDWALAHAHAQGNDAILLSVYADNSGAQRFYQRYGFAKIADITFKVGDHYDPEYLYELKL